MRVEEKCCCGAMFVVCPELSSYNRTENKIQVDAAWKHVGRWRKVHEPCRKAHVAAQAQTHIGGSEE